MKKKLLVGAGVIGGIALMGAAVAALMKRVDISILSDVIGDDGICDGCEGCDGDSKCDPDCPGCPGCDGTDCEWNLNEDDAKCDNTAPDADDKAQEEAEKTDDNPVESVVIRMQVSNPPDVNWDEITEALADILPDLILSSENGSKAKPSQKPATENAVTE